MEVAPQEERRIIKPIIQTLEIRPVEARREVEIVIEKPTWVVREKRVQVPIEIPQLEYIPTRASKCSTETQTDRDMSGTTSNREVITSPAPPPPPPNRGNIPEDANGDTEDTSSREDPETESGTDNEDAPPPPPGNSEDEEGREGEEDYNEEEVARRFAAINDKRDLEEAMTWVKSLRIGEEAITIETPLIKAMRISGRWPGIGMYGCTRCDQTFGSSRAFSLHMKNVHAEKVVNFRWQEQIEYVVGLKLRWRCTGPAIEQYKKIANCPYVNCSYVGMLPEALSSHMAQVHHDLLAMANELGLMYATIIMHARNFRRIPSAEKLIRPTDGALCKKCMWFVGKDRQCVAQHARKAHVNADIEGAPTETQRVEITPEWFRDEEEQPTEGLRRANEGIQGDQERRSAMRNRREMEGNLDMNEVQRPERAEEARERRLERERAQREQRELGRRNQEAELSQTEDRERLRGSQSQDLAQPQRLNPSTPPSSSDTPETQDSEATSSETSQRSSDSERNNEPETDELDRLLTNDEERRAREEERRMRRDENRPRQERNNGRRRRPQDRRREQEEAQMQANPWARRYNEEQLLELARRWAQEGEEQEQETINLPKLWGNKWRKIQKKITNALRTKLLPVMEGCMNPEFSEEAQWYIWEGFLWKAKSIVRKEIRRVLKIPVDHQNGRFRHDHRRDEEGPRGIREVRRAGKLINTIQQIREIKRAGANQVNNNLVAKLHDKACKLIQELPEDLSQIVGEKTPETIDILIDEREERLDYIKAQLIRRETELGTSSMKKMTRELYKEDPARALRWLVLDDKSPECQASLEELEETYGTKWEETVDFEEKEEWQVRQTQDPEELAEDLRRLLDDEELIRRTITTRSNVSAHGVDGLGNAVWKADPDITVKLVRQTMKMMLQTGKFPESMKAAKTIFLYKGGESRDPRAWRPITMMTTLYRIITAHIAHCIQLANRRHRLISPQQKGFMLTPAGAIEHITTINELISDARRRSKSLYMLSLDLRDAFGSVPHELIFTNMRRMGIQSQLIEATKDMYEGCTTRMFVNQETSRQFELRRGVKQGCPLSPTLFNISIEPLIQRLNGAAEQEGYHIAEEAVAVLAYADDVMIVSDSEEGLNNLITIVEQFCGYACLTINPKKCRSLSYIVEGTRRSTASTIFRIAEEPIPAVAMTGTCDYLGSAIGVVGAKRMRARISLLERAEADATLITTSCLKDNQVLDAIRRFIVPRLEYALMSNTMSKKGIRELDTKIRGILDRRFHAMGIPRDFFYTNWKDGGLSLKSLEERQAELTLDTYTRLYDSDDPQTRHIFRYCVEEEIRKRGWSRNETSTNLGVQRQEGHRTTPRGTHCLLARAMKAVEFLEVGVSRREEKFWIRDERNEEAREEEVRKKPANLLPFLNTLLAQRHAEKLAGNPMKGHTFPTLRKSPISSYFMDWRSKIANGLIRFAWRARTNSLRTGEIDRRADGGMGNCQICGQPDSLMHRLNGCPRKKHLFKPRHDSIVDIVAEAVRRQTGTGTRALHFDCTVKGPEGEDLTDEETRRLKPDIWFYQGRTLKVIEVTVPYGQMTERGGERISTLKARREEKLNKYEQLMAAARRQFQIQTELYVIVVSSLGALPEETLRDLRRLVLDRTNTTGKRLVAAALKGSYDIYSNRTRSRTTGGNIQGRAGEEESDGEQRQGEREDQRDRHGEQIATSQTDNEDPWLPEREGTDEEDETEAGSDDSEERGRHGDSSNSEEDPATPWWVREEREPEPREGEDQNGRAQRALDALLGQEVRPRPVEQVDSRGGQMEPPGTSNFRNHQSTGSGGLLEESETIQEGRVAPRSDGTIEEEDEERDEEMNRDQGHGSPIDVVRH